MCGVSAVAVPTIPEEGKEMKTSVIDFLTIDRPREELKIALDVLNDFRECHNGEEWFLGFSMTWQKLEQYLEFLEHMVNGQELEDDTVEYKAFVLRARDEENHAKEKK
jgi:hypothetical protein